MHKGFLAGVLAIGVMVSAVTGRAAFAAHPLATDDTGTQGAGKFEIEFGAQYDQDKETDAGVTVKAAGYEAAVTFAAGVFETVDIEVGVPYQGYRVKEDGAVVADEDGMADATVAVKWRFFEREGLSFAIMPGLSFPTGDEDEGFGTGKVTYGALFIATLEAGKWLFHGNAGYTRNENDFDERESIWNLSAAAEFSVTEAARLVGEIGTETSVGTDPAFALAGVIYSAGENLDLDAGFRVGLNDVETDYSVLAGVTTRF
jgi:hypothetical protein